MTVKKIGYCITIIIVFFSWVNFVHANLEIKEVMYNPAVKTDHLWIKVYNNDSSDVNLTDWSVADYDGTSWHYHAINTDGSSTLAANSYTIIAKSSLSTIDAFKSKNPDISEPLFYGNLTIGSEGILGLSLDKKTIIGETSYGGADATQVDNSTTNNDTASDNTSSSTSNSGTSKDEPEIFKITTKIISTKTTVAGIPFSVSPLTTTNTGKTFAVGKFIWNFGDGMVKEMNNSNPFDYAYDYPGDYVLTLSYYSGHTSDVVLASDRITIKVVSSEIYVSSIGNGTDPFIEIENKSSSEIMLSNWVVTAGIHYFVIPSGTTLLPGSVIITNSNKEIVATYPAQAKVPVQKNLTSNNSIPGNSVPNTSPQNNPPTNDSQIINLNDLGASASDSGIKVSESSYPIIGLLVVIGLGISSFLLIKMRNKNSDYIGKEIRAEDMTIVE
jgi:hypothetical protein